MRVAIEATPLAVPTGGITRYTRELALALARCFPEDEYILVSDQPFELPSPGLRRGAAPSSAWERRWWLLGMERVRADLIHGPDFSVPYLGRRPSVLTLHDLWPWRSGGGSARVRRRTPYLLKLRIATMVIVPSQAVRREAIDAFGLHPSRVAVTPLAAAAVFRPAARPLPATPYILYAGTLEPRKNISVLIEAWRELRRFHAVDLVLAGRRRDGFPEPAPEAGLRLAGVVTDEDMAALYSGAAAVVCPSAYEGFGLPVIEAMQCGACVVASRDPAVMETAGGAAIHVTPDARELYLAMRSLVEKPDPERRARSLARAAEFSWERTAKLTREVYEEAVRRFAA